MYSTITFKKFTITFHTFRKAAKKISPAYRIGFHYWVDDTQRNFNIVFPFCFRIIFSRDLPYTYCRGEAPVKKLKKNS